MILKLFQGCKVKFLKWFQIEKVIFCPPLTECSMLLTITWYWELLGDARRSFHFCLNVNDPKYILPVCKRYHVGKKIYMHNYVRLFWMESFAIDCHTIFFLFNSSFGNKGIKSLQRYWIIWKLSLSYSSSDESLKSRYSRIESLLPLLLQSC